MSELAGAELIAPRRRPLRYELMLVVVVAAAVLVPGIWSYSLVDPWETHYGEVAREMLEYNDFAQTRWRGTYVGDLNDNEGFRSKPVLMFWMMAAGLEAVGVARDGGYSGELTESPLTMVGIRLPFIASAIAGLALMWWMLARLVSRRLAWLGLLVVGSTPMFCMVARQAIPDMPLTACTIGALSLFLLAVEDGDRPIVPLAYLGRRRIPIDARHVVLGVIGGFLVLQAVYYAIYFTASPILAVRGRVPNVAILLPSLILFLMWALSRDGFLIIRLPFVLIGGVIAAIVNEPMPRRQPGQSFGRHLVDDILMPWERHDPIRYLLRGLAFVVCRSFGEPREEASATAIGFADRVLRMQPLTSMRQLYLLGMYFLVGFSVLAKGPPGLTVIAGVAAFHVVLSWRWRELYDGAFELKRALLVMIAVALPWHLAMYFKDGSRFVNEYLFLHILNRAGSIVDNSPGTFHYYTTIIGHGMWLWAALVPAALGAAVVRARRDTREGRVRFTVALWAIVAMTIFCLVQTKFHHYILPVLPPLGLLVAFFLDDLIARRDRLHPVLAALGVGIVFLICRDLMHEPDRWIEMYVFRDDRPWPSAEPWAIDVSDGFLGLGIAGAIAIAIAATRYVRTGVALIGGVGLAICIWALQVYMPPAGTHWGMREAMRTYYEQRTIYGQKLFYYSDQQLADDWAGVGNTWAFETFVPDPLQIGQPMTITVRLHKVEDERVIDTELALVGEVTEIGAHRIEVTLAPGERARLQLLIDRKRTVPGKSPRRPPLRFVDADKLIAWQLYWRGENFWSNGEIWGDTLELKTAFPNPNNTEFQKYINDRSRSPLGRRYFVITDSGRATSIKSSLPTERAQRTYEVLNTTSNKFSLGAFEM